MKLNVKQAYEKIGKEDLKKIEEKNHYLNAVISIMPPDKKEPENFIFTFLNSDKNTIIQTVVTDKKVEVKESQKGTHPTKERLNIDEVKIFSDKIIEKALEEFKKIGQPMSQIILALEEDKWKVTIITKLLQVFIIEFDSKTGKVKSSHTESLTTVS